MIDSGGIVMIGAHTIDSRVGAMFRQLKATLFIAQKYREEKDSATDRIIRRQSRGNVPVQNGWYLTKAKLLELSRAADDKMKYLRSALR